MHFPSGRNPGGLRTGKSRFKRKAVIKVHLPFPDHRSGNCNRLYYVPVPDPDTQDPVFAGLLAGHFMVTLPYVIRVVGSSMEQFDFSIEEAAWSLGCPKGAAFFKVVLPNVTSGISSAFMLAFINSFNNIPVSMFLSGPGVSTFPSTLMNYIEYNYDPTVSAVSVLLMAATVVIMVIVDRTLGIAAWRNKENMTMAFMSLNGIDVSYDKKKQILKGLNLEVEEGELVSLLGPSGCGKSTTLRVVAGFINPQGGTFTLDGEDMTKVPVHKRQFGLVFQSYALFPHLSVYDNVAFGLRTRKMDKDLIDKKVREILEVCGLTELADRFPKQMSGGQRQRVALARALVIEPKLLLLDEPLSNLDAKLRLSMRVEIKRLQKRLGITTLFVTHDQEECFSISDKVAVMNGGVIEQFDTPENIYKRPATEFVARFIGFENFLELAKKQDGVYTAPDGSEFLTSVDLDCEKFAGTIRPDDICLADDVQTENVLSGKIGVRTFLGKSYQYEVETSAGVLKVNMGTDHVYKEGEEIRLYLPKDKLILVRR